MRCTVFLAALIYLAGCEQGRVDPTLVQQVNALEVTQRQRRAEVDSLERRGAQLRAELQQMQERLALARCQAVRAEVRATSARMVAQCQDQRIQFAQCNADAARRSADNTMAGAFLGFAAAALTGGAAAPLVLGGSVLGRASTGDGACGVFPSCSTEASAYQAEAMRQLSVTTLPSCQDPDSSSSMASGSCFFSMPNPFYLRPTESIEDRGPSFRGGMEAMIVRAGTLVRADGRRAALTRLRDGREGWAFFTEGQLRRYQCRVSP